jgi:hypothetical protein
MYNLICFACIYCICFGFFFNVHVPVSCIWFYLFYVWTKILLVFWFKFNFVCLISCTVLPYYCCSSKTIISLLSTFDFERTHMLKVIPEEEFEDTKGVIRISKSKVRQHNCQTNKDKGQKERYTKHYTEN